MSQLPAPVSISQSSAPTPSGSSSNIEGIFDAALKSYKKKTKKDLKNHDLFKQLETCDSPATILAVFQAAQFDGNEGLKKWLVPAINVLYAFSEALGEGISLVFSPAKVVFAGVGVLLLAAKGVAESQDILIDIFGRIESFFVRLEIYTGVPLGPAMTDKMVEITVEILDILATATKEMKQSRAKKFLKKVAGLTDLEDGLKKLEKMTNEEIAMASARLVKVTDNIDIKVTGVGEGVRGVDEKVQAVTGEVQVVHDNVKAVEDKVQTMAEDGKATAMEVKLVLQQTAKTANDVDEVKRNQLRESLRKWQSPPDPSTNHNIAGDRQHEGTAEWFFESDKFEEWKLAGSLLWIHGKPGSGKSILCSAIINNITTLCEAGSASMAYFYFDFRDDDKQARSNLLPSLLVQLSNRSDAFFDVLFRLYKTHDNGARQPSDKALTQCLKDMLTLPNQGPVYLIMDALDECPDTSDVPSTRAQVLDLIKDLVSLRLPGLHICATSRPEVDISDVLGSIASQAVSLHEERGQEKDIAEYVRFVVYSGSSISMRRWREEEKEHVIETLSQKADGMFRWIFCQLEMLRKCLPQNVRRVLMDLPKSLDETYERMLREIGRVNPDQAYRLLQCLTVATRPLRVEELAEVLALEYDGAREGIPILNKDWRWDDHQQGVLSTCSSLIVVVNGDGDDDDDDGAQTTRVVQFAHFSVKEFLTSDRLANLKEDISRFHIRLEQSHTILAQACLAILLRSDYTDEAENRSPLSDYAARHWVDHTQFENVSSRVEGGMRRLFDPAKPYFTDWLESFNIDKKWGSFFPDTTAPSPPSSATSSSTSLDFLRPPSFTSSEADAPLCLYYAAFCGLRDLTKHLIAEYPQHVNASIGRNKSPLAAALCNGHIRVAELLHQHGAVLHIGREGCTLLHAASDDGSMDVARWLLNIGADANAQDDDHMTPLHFSAANGHLELVRTLLGHTVDVNIATARFGDTPLHKALRGGHMDIVRLLIHNGANVNAFGSVMPLQIASTQGNPEIVRLLVDHGADVNARGWSQSTPLHEASSAGEAEIAQLLIQFGADVNARDWRQWTPLLLASSARDAEIRERSIPGVSAWDWSQSTPLLKALSSRKADIAQLLIQFGADVNARDENQSTPLHEASSTGKAAIVQLLIQFGADVNARDESQSTPLHQASSSGNAEIVQLLIQFAADVNIRNENRSTPLHLSAWDAEIAQVLIHHGADVNARDGSQSTPLHVASYSGNAETARLLIQLGADLDARNENQSTPLHRASFSGQAEIVQLLLQLGADVNARDANQSTPLHLASSLYMDDESVVRLLIEHGADVNAYDENHKTPLHQVAYSWRSDAKYLRVLLENGADVDVEDSDGLTPFQIASSKGHAEMAQLLWDVSNRM